MKFLLMDLMKELSSATCADANNAKTVSKLTPNELYKKYHDARKNEDNINDAIDKLNQTIDAYTDWMLTHTPNADKLITQLKAVRANYQLELIKYHDQSEEAFKKYKNAVSDSKYREALYDAIRSIIPAKDADNHAVNEVDFKPATDDPKLAK